MAQYLIFLAVFPFALTGTILAIAMPRLAHSYDRFAWLKLYNFLQLGFLLVNLTELLVGDPALKQALAAADYLFIGSVPSTWLLFSLEYTGIARRTKPWHALLFIMPIVACVCGLFAADSGLVWKDLEVYRVGWITAMRSSGYGPAALAMFFQSYSFVIVGSILLIQHTAMTHSLFRKQTFWLMAGVLLPLVSNFAFILKVVPGWNKDYSALSLALGGFCLSIGCLRTKLLTVVPVSRKALFHQMRLGMIVTDPAGVIVDLNLAACRMLGRSEIALLGSPSDHLLNSLPPRFELSRHQVLDAAGNLQAWHLELREQDSRAAANVDSAPEAARMEEAEVSYAEDGAFLSLGELRVVEMLARNLSNKEIADRLGVSVNTVKFHLSNAYGKTGSHSRAELVHRIAEISNAKG